MSNYEQYVIEQAARTATKLRELATSGNITIESASPIGEAMALLQILSRALEGRNEHAV
jgi:hypothetical protein